MRPVMKKEIFPLIGKVKWEGFNKNSFGHVLSLRFKLIKHINSKNSEKLKNYLAFCIQEWPDFSDCPLDKEILSDALNVIDRS